MSWKANVPVNKITQWRRHFHQHPELSFKEYESTKYILNILSEYPELEILFPDARTGIMAVLKTGRPGKTLALRADYDALAIHEETDLPFKSQVDGVMHACGHDCHVSMLLGALDVLYGMRDKLKGTIKFIFQHAEEDPPGGARDFVKAGLLDDVEFVFGMHVAVPVPTGLALLVRGTASAGSESFFLEIQGKGGHSSAPENCIDPLHIGIQIVNQFNSIIPKKISAKERAVFSVNQFRSGDSHNIIPDTAVLKGNVRHFSNDVKDIIISTANEIVDSITKLYGATYTMKWVGYPCMVHDDEAVDLLKGAAGKIVGESHLKEIGAMTASEDFSILEEGRKGAYLLLGAGTNGAGPHNPKFCVDESILGIGTQIHVQAALDTLGIKED